MKYRVTVETLTPLHIGSGAELIAQFDYVSQGNITYILDQDAIYAAELARNGPKANLGQPAAMLINPSQLAEDSPFIRYALKGGTTIERIQEQIKDVQGQPYLPGSSLKGAIRTSLMSYQTASGTVLSLEALGKEKGKKEEAAQNWERRIFGRSPHHDILRALQVSDSAPLPLSPSPLELASVRVFETAEKISAPIEVEAISKGVVFQTEIQIDELALKEADKLDWKDRRFLLMNLVAIVQQISQRRIAAERDALEQRGLAGAARFYQNLEAFSKRLEGRQAALLQLGWGTGWTGMTIGPFLPRGAQDEIRRRYELGRPPKARGKWEPDLGQPFPKSRRLTSIPAKLGPAQAGVPLGWVALSFEPVGKPHFEAQWAQLEKEASRYFHPLPTIRKVEPKREANGSAQPLGSPKEHPEQPTPTKERLTRPASPPARLIVRSFTELPRPGDYFRGRVLFVEKDGVFLEVPGLSPDDLILGVLTNEDNPDLRKPREGTVLLCEVIAVEPEPHNPGHWFARCLVVG